MAPRPAWRGYLKLSLVTCAVELSNATTQSEKVSFRVINRKTGNTVKRQYVDAESGKRLADKDEVKGYETGTDEYLLIEEEDIEAVQIEASHTLSLDGFVGKGDIDQIYLDTPYYLAPADKVSEEAFSVIREALTKKKMAGLARIVLYRRERPVVIEPFGAGMLLTTLRYGSTVRHVGDVLEEGKKPELDEEMIELAERFIERHKGKFDPSTFEDRYETALLELIKSKKAGRKPPKAKPAAPKPSNVVNLFDALKKSLAGGDDNGGDGKAPAKRTASAKGKHK
ncbi:Ku protein [Mesorhizobium sp. LHD-90]|uniref:non-homologous end joining protein Ku n=1 Tax=Mesorhizobium sp. LHD-90 TaxID=3071414 RepID=UPI0027E1C69E|nr:Ku protein [Mesorhizobium sp. LHD-90]MDQ6432604.1 Ku protein [Mesorhizobium sp. LHD-90]